MRSAPLARSAAAAALESGASKRASATPNGLFPFAPLWPNASSERRLALLLLLNSLARPNRVALISVRSSPQSASPSPWPRGGDAARPETNFHRCARGTPLSLPTPTSKRLPEPDGERCTTTSGLSGETALCAGAWRAPCVALAHGLGMALMQQPRGLQLLHSLRTPVHSDTRLGMLFAWIDMQLPLRRPRQRLCAVAAAGSTPLACRCLVGDKQK